MGRARQDRGGELEAKVMASVWAAAEPVTVRQVVEELNRERPRPLAYTTVMTVMSRLVEKGALRRSRAGRGYEYQATAPDAAGVAVNRLLREHGDAALAHFVEEARQDPALRDRLRTILEQGDG